MCVDGVMRGVEGWSDEGCGGMEGFGCVCGQPLGGQGIARVASVEGGVRVCLEGGVRGVCVVG